MLSRILRTAALVYLFIGAGLMMAAKAVEKPSASPTCCGCDSKPAPEIAADQTPLLEA